MILDFLKFPSDLMVIAPGFEPGTHSLEGCGRPFPSVSPTRLISRSYTYFKGLSDFSKFDSIRSNSTYSEVTRSKSGQFLNVPECQKQRLFELKKSYTDTFKFTTRLDVPWGESMAKRFTDTKKWGDPWFSELSPKTKCLWVFLCDQCDEVGIWKVNLPLASFFLGEKVVHGDLEALGRRLVWLGEDKVWLPGFLVFQYGTLSNKSKAHLGIMRKILKEVKDLPLDEKNKNLIEGFETLLRGSSEGLQTLQVKDKVKVKVKKLKGGVGEKYTPEFEAAWKEYPRKDDKSDAFKAYQKNVNPDEHQDAIMAISKYRAKLDRDGSEARFIKHGATFFNERRWRNCLEPGYGESEDFSSNTPSSVDFSRYKEGEIT